MSSFRPQPTAPARWAWRISGGLSEPLLRRALGATGIPVALGAVDLSRTADLSDALGVTAVREARLIDDAGAPGARLCLARLGDAAHALLVTTRRTLGAPAQRALVGALLRGCGTGADQDGEAARTVAQLLREASAHAPDAPPTPGWEWPADGPSPHARNRRAEYVTLAGEVPAALTAWCHTRGVELWQALLAGVVAVLARYGGAPYPAVAVDVPAATHTAQVPGPRGLRLHWTDTGTTATLTRALVDALRTDRPAESCAPESCPVLFSYAGDDPGTRAGLRAEPVPVTTGWADHDVSITAHRLGDRFHVRIAYDTDTVTHHSAERLAERLLAMWERWPGEPALATLTALTFAEHRRVLTDGRGPAEPWPDVCVHSLIEERACRTPGRMAVVCGGDRLTYGELDALANRTARRLRQLGARPEDAVAVMAPRSTDAVVAILAVLKAGAGYVPIDPSYPAERIHHVLRDSGARLAVGVPDTLRALPSLEAVTAVDLLGDEVAAEESAALEPLAGPGNLAYVMYTSGSTGRPKGVAVPHRALVLSNAARSIGGDPPDVDLLTMPLCFDGSMSGMYWTLTGGGTLVLPTDDEVRDPRKVVALAASWPVTNVHSIPSYYALLLDSCDEDDLPALRHVSVGGEPLPPRLVGRHLATSPHALLLNDYGPTETTVWASAHACTPADASSESVPIGRPLPNYRLYVLDEGLRLVPPGLPGELYIGGPGVARGYLGRAALTAGVFAPDPYGSGPGARLYRTGDRARHRADGIVELLGRVDDQVKIRGFRVELGEVESVLLRHSAIAEAAVLLSRSQPGAPRLIAYVVLQDDTAAEPDVRAWIDRALPSYMRPDTVQVLSSLPRNHNGKIDTRALPGASGSLPGNVRPPRRSPSVDGLTIGQVDALLSQLAARRPAL
ncbi:amino acid adenylation domain-containing protein [Streptomyces sp. NPDC048312]|uniref:Amino acid adenylation domain-containing protein n=1 Tax=Streptomyces melanovinaceus TaxID=1182637 RepID=A0A060NZE1_9ACTN|nr:amino acid adenylation domain-containing protein [Streptomyces melanovinaceus]BAO84868.1 putative non-ribosomal peptide synthetase [Streptomyces melanovinaceus]